MADKDDDTFEDADFEDLDPIEDEDEDDLADDSWDEDDSTGDLAEGDNDSGEDAVAPAKSKTFVQKNFMLIVGGVVVVFGGLIAMSMMGGSSPPATTAESDLTIGTSDIVELSDQSELPPMPAPINATQEPTAPEDNALTPLPTPQDLQNAELAELTIEEVPASPAGKTTPQGQAPFDFQPTEQPADQNADGNVDGAEKLNAEFRERAQTAPEMDISETAIPSENKVAPATVLAESASAAEADSSALAEQVKAQEEKIKLLEAKIADADAEAKKSQAAAEKSAQDALKLKNSEIAGLSKKISDLEKKLADAKASAQSAREAEPAPIPLVEKAPQPVSITEAQEEKPAEETPVAEASKPVPTAEKPKPTQTASKPVATKWELKGAQPGKAMLESKVTGDIRNVGIGDRVDGLGKITAIAKENGRWTVRGTSGTVTR